MQKKKLLWTLFIKSLILSASTFGGGFVIVSLMRRMYVEKLGLLTEEEMMDVAAVSQSAPGAVAVNASILLGYKTAGLSGALVCVVGTILPPLFVMSVVARLYSQIRGVPSVSKIMLGMQAGVAAVVLNAVVGMTRSAFQTRRKIYYVLFVSVFLLRVIFQLDAVFCIAFAAALGLFDAQFSEKRHRI